LVAPWRSLPRHEVARGILASLPRMCWPGFARRTGCPGFPRREPKKYITADTRIHRHDTFHGQNYQSTIHVYAYIMGWLEAAGPLARFGRRAGPGLQVHIYLYMQRYRKRKREIHLERHILTHIYIHMLFERPGSPWLSEILSVLALISEEPKEAALGGTVLSQSAI